MPITITIDLEDPTKRYEPDGRYVAMSQRILALCDEYGCKATFFVEGRVAESAPSLIRRIAGKGHEIGSHSHEHDPLTLDSRDKMRCVLRNDKDRLEQLAGRAVVGYRAPCFSLTHATRWAVDVLGELGFLYSSSLMPSSFSRYGYPHAPDTAFRWPNGLIEFPLPMYRLGRLRVPYSGGIYLYILPAFLSAYWARQATGGGVLWTYAHPYDFDRDELWSRMPNTPLWVNAVLLLARCMAETKIRNIIAKCGVAAPLKDRLTENNYQVWGGL